MYRKDNSPDICLSPAVVLGLLDEVERLEAERDALAREVREWLCEQCHTVYPGPPQAGWACVQCPHCGGNCGPHEMMRRRAAEACVAALEGALDAARRI